MNAKAFSRLACGGLVLLSACASETMKSAPGDNTPATHGALPSSTPIGTNATANPSTGMPSTATTTTTTTTTTPTTTTPTTTTPSGTGNTPAAGTQPTLDPSTPLSQIPASCKGFEVVGLKESPGGKVLPNTCAPFHGTLNNPYAIRCVDADPKFSTGFAGDQYCILPPPAALGAQIHVGPDSYDNPGQFVLAVGQEIDTNYYINAPNADAHYYYRTNWRMRPGSHHMIITTQDADLPDGWAGSTTGGSTGGGLGTAGSHSFGGAQRVDQDRPQGTLDVPPENQGIGAQLGAKQQFTFNLHHINASDKPELREVWVNVWYMADKDVTQKMQGMSASGSPADVAIPAHQKTVLQYKCNVTGDARIITMIGHRHAHTDRFGIWVQRKSGEMVDAYESFNWEDMPTYQYDSVSTNPTPDVTGRVDGASSGELTLSAGDQLFFECDINNDLDVPLKFANETFTGEMCIVFGSYIGTSPCSGVATRVK